MKRQYQYEGLSRRHGFTPAQIEKACRISDVLEDVSNVPFLRKRLCLYGGTALAFLHFPELERLSVDIDFNYRHIDLDLDWGEVRNRVDDSLKRVLFSQGYVDGDIKINATYPLCRHTVGYTNHLGRRDDFKLETGYMRRAPILMTDTEYTFNHIGIDTRFMIKSPMKEELFSNKWCTMLYRGSSRDLFDVYRISQKAHDRDLFRTAAVIDSLMRRNPKLTEIDIQDTVDTIRVDTYLMNVLKDDSTYDVKELKTGVIEFSEEVVSALTEKEEELIETFYNRLKFEPKRLGKRGLLHKDIERHPMILRAIQQLSQ